MPLDNPQDQATSSASPIASLSSLFLSNPRSACLPNPNPNPNRQIHLPLRTQTLTFSSNSSQFSTATSSAAGEEIVRGGHRRALPRNCSANYKEKEWD
ncbi:hypothetical protein LOK49_LG12G00251 [Camellia lanceoleosa]|uniref:Uncharacterized protein n=1 Tax=Camellia lanceoleosa TaxID=1840588 RepID=A0ACC0FR24_9ERIC|nr:hypothetical protein LOK49_LG12G00251 [Camellia lanceoleosa]